MPLNLFARYRGYNALPVRQPSPSSNDTAQYPEKRLHPGLYDPPPMSPDMLGSTSGWTTLRTADVSRQGPLIDYHIEDADVSDQDTAHAVEQVRSELTRDECYPAVGTVLTVQEAALGEVPARRGISRPGRAGEVDGGGGYSTSYDAWCEDLRGYFGVDEDMDEIRRELGFDDREGTVSEIIFDSDVSWHDEGMVVQEDKEYGYGSGSDSNIDSNWESASNDTSDEDDCSDQDGNLLTGSTCLEESWRTAVTPQADSNSEKLTSPPRNEAKGKFLHRWFGVDCGALIAEDIPAASASDELVGLAHEEAVQWASSTAAQRHGDHLTGDDSPKLPWSENTGDELDNVWERMGSAEEGRAAGLGLVKKPGYDEDESPDENEYVIVDYPGMDFFDRFAALEGASLRKGEN
jgi:hypothetical protein